MLPSSLDMSKCQWSKKTHLQKEKVTRPKVLHSLLDDRAQILSFFYFWCKANSLERAFKLERIDPQEKEEAKSKVSTG